MRFPLRSVYALQAVVDLASSKTQGPVRIADIAQRQKIPQKFLELILASLRQAGLVESRRGAEGGYLLARPPETITVGDVLRAIEGSRPKTYGGAEAETPLSDLWRRVDEAVSQIVDRTTLADLVRTWEEKQARYVPNWEI